MIGLKALLEYPSHVRHLNMMGGMQVLQKAATIFTQKNGTQQIKNTPMMIPVNYDQHDNLSYIYGQNASYS